jgi:hypothetical protein
MLLRSDNDGVLAIGQLSHAWLSGQIARAWGNTQFGQVEPREEIVLGAQQHDIGWALFDLEPRFNPETGLPRSFLELTTEEHLEIWRTAPDRLMSQSLYAALVVSMHGRSLSELRMRSAPGQSAALQVHIDEEQARQQQICATLGISEAQAERTQRQMWTWDGLSLALCSAWRPFVANRVPTADGTVAVELLDRADGTSTLDPWPLGTQAIELRCEARRLQAGYSNAAEMMRAFERARPVTLRFTLVAPGGQADLNPSTLGVRSEHDDDGAPQ